MPSAAGYTSLLFPFICILVQVLPWKTFKGILGFGNASSGENFILKTEVISVHKKHLRGGRSTDLHGSECSSQAVEGRVAGRVCLCPLKMSLGPTVKAQERGILLESPCRQKTKTYRYRR